MMIHRRISYSSFCLTATEAAPASEPYRTFKRYNFVNNANREGVSKPASGIAKGYSRSNSKNHFVAAPIPNGIGPTDKLCYDCQTCQNEIVKEPKNCRKGKIAHFFRSNGNFFYRARSKGLSYRMCDSRLRLVTVSRNLGLVTNLLPDSPTKTDEASSFR